MDKKGTITGMYDLKGQNLSTKMKDVLLDQQFYKEMKMRTPNNSKTNKERFEEHPECFTECIRYSPCPICNKCLNKGSHLYEKCGECLIPRCNHKFTDKLFLIRRTNFRIHPDDNVKQNIREL